MKGLSNDCAKGIRRSTYSTNTELIDKAYVSGTFNDNYFQGSFCPPSSGLYRLIYEGPLNEGNEASWSSYSFNGIKTKSRTTSYHYLFSGACYAYNFEHIISLFFISSKSLLSKRF